MSVSGGGSVGLLHSCSTDKLFKLVKYCDYYQFFLVEELALLDDYSKLHYGKCFVLGKLRENTEGYFELENIKLPNFPSEYSLPEGTASVRLLRFNYYGDKLQHGRFCEVSGEVVLLHKQDHTANRVPLSARGVQERMVQMRNDERRQAYLASLLKTHQPAVRLYNVDEVDRAGELAERNLEIRMISQRERS